MLRKTLRYRKRLKSFLKTFSGRRAYLAPGTYYVDVHLKFLYRDDPLTRDFMQSSLLMNKIESNSRSGLKFTVKKWMAPSRVILDHSPRSTIFDGTIYLPANNNVSEKNVKIFNLKTDELLTAYASSERLAATIEHYEFFSPYFRIPGIKTYDLKQKICTEELIHFIAKNKWSDADHRTVIATIFQTYQAYYEAMSMNGNIYRANIKSALEELKRDADLGRLAAQIEDELPKQLIMADLPKIRQHGDLWLYNSLLGEDQTIYFIDWEHAGYHSLFYDQFWWMQNEAIFSRNNVYLIQYLDGAYDAQFSSLASALAYDFNDQYRKEYLYLYLIEMLYTRVYGQPRATVKYLESIYSKLFVDITKHA